MKEDVLMHSRLHHVRWHDVIQERTTRWQTTPCNERWSGCMCEFELLDPTPKL